MEVLKAGGSVQFISFVSFEVKGCAARSAGSMVCCTAHPEIPAVGNYITLTGKADRIDPVFRTLQVGETVVPFEDLVEISGESIMEIDQYLGITED